MGFCSCEKQPVAKQPKLLKPQVPQVQLMLCGEGGHLPTKPTVGVENTLCSNTFIISLSFSFTPLQSMVMQENNVVLLNYRTLMCVTFSSSIFCFLFSSTAALLCSSFCFISFSFLCLSSNCFSYWSFAFLSFSRICVSLAAVKTF